MNLAIRHSHLTDIYDKVVAQERITEADALRLFESKDINAVGAIADFVRTRKVGNRASYILNRYKAVYLVELFLQGLEEIYHRLPQ